MTKLLGILILSAAFSATAQAHHHDGPPSDNDHPGWSNDPPDRDHKNIRIVAPEIDPATAISGLTLLAGGLAVIRGRKRK